MLLKYRKLILPVVLAASSAFVAIVFASTGSDTTPMAISDVAPTTDVIQSDQIPAGNRISNQAEHMRRTLLPLGFRTALSALGDRIEKPGKERLTFTGTLQRAGHTQALPFSAIYQQPGRLRFQDGQGLELRTITFNGQRAQKLGGKLSREEEALVEMLVYDTPEGFFNGQMDRVPTRFLGSRFRADDGTLVNYVGPFYDIYQVTDQMKVKGDVLQRSKLFLLNSDTQLLEIVRYQIERDGIKADVEVQLGDWQKTQNQMFPRRFVRLENNVQILTLTITSVIVSPGTEDGSFSATQGQ